MINREDFDKLPVNEKRKAIAQDVLDRMDRRLIKPEKGTLFGPITKGYITIHSPHEVFNTNECQVCAKGALVCSWVGSFNKYTSCDVWRFSFNISSRNAYPEELLEIFGREMLDNIECAYEGFVYNWNYDYVRFASKNQRQVEIDSPFKDNLRKIMETIVKNDGEFPWNAKDHPLSA